MARCHCNYIFFAILNLNLIFILQPAPPNETKLTNTVWAVCFRPGNIKSITLFISYNKYIMLIDGEEVLLAVADRIFIYNAKTGEMIK